MARDVIMSRVQLLHDTEAHWKQVKSTFIPLAGEPCVTIDGPNRNKVKYGDGLHTWGEIEYSGDTGIAVDNKSITVVDNNYAIYGFKEATANQVPVKDVNGELSWVTPPRCNIEKVCIGDIASEIVPTADHEVVIPIATGSNLGVVKGSPQIEIGNDGSMTLKDVPSDVISNLNGLAENVSTILNLKPIASADVDTDQFDLQNGVLSIKKVDSDIVHYQDTNVENALNDIADSIDTIDNKFNWNDF